MKDGEWQMANGFPIGGTYIDNIILGIVGVGAAHIEPIALLH